MKHYISYRFSHPRLGVVVHADYYWLYPPGLVGQRFLSMTSLHLVSRAGGRYQTRRLAALWTRLSVLGWNVYLGSIWIDKEWWRTRLVSCPIMRASRTGVLSMPSSTALRWRGFDGNNPMRWTNQRTAISEWTIDVLLQSVSFITKSHGCCIGPWVDWPLVRMECRVAPTPHSTLLMFLFLCVYQPELSIYIKQYKLKQDYCDTLVILNI